MNKDNVEIFKSSWQQVFDKRAYVSKHLPEYTTFLEMLIEKGWNERFRAVTSLYDVVLSRSLEYGLKQGQLFITFNFSDIISKLQQRNGIQQLLKEEKISEKTRSHCEQLSTKVDHALVSIMGKVQMIIGDGFGEFSGNGPTFISLDCYSEKLDQHLLRLLEEPIN